MSKRSQVVLLHVFGCIAFLALPVLFSPDFNKTGFLSIRPFQVDFLTSLFMVGFFYLSYYLLVPRFFFRKKYGLFLLLTVLSLVAILILPHLLAVGQKMHPHEQDHMQVIMRPRPPADDFFRHFLFDLRQRFLQFLVPLTLSLLLRVNGRWREAENAKRKAELSYLRAQINPHFLFNILNSIYSLSIEKSEYTPEAIVKLSGMMRYMLEESDKKLVPLEHEIDYIVSYIDLQKLRHGNSIRLTYSVTGNMNGYLIAPLMLIPFVENAFKHGINAEEDSELKVTIEVKKNKLQLSVWNSKVFIQEKKEDRQGLGVENTRNRLQMVYPGKHELILEDKKDYYSVKLTIQLS